MAEVVVRSTQPALGAVKLAWWRERLAELDEGKVPAEPRLQAAAVELLPRGIRGADLSILEEGWAALLSERPDVALLAEHGARLFELGARLLDVPFEEGTIGLAGGLYARADASRRGLIDIVEGRASGAMTIPRGARALTGLAALAARDLRRGKLPLEPEGTPGRAWALLRHRFTGRLPRY